MEGLFCSALAVVMRLGYTLGWFTNVFGPSTAVVCGYCHPGLVSVKHCPSCTLL